ncbi:MAG: hypothetical protein HYR74_12615 [Candidatus Eisenbacteria bacterium]|nr:hypothetical protein [Candidatus Eisenbacteria bacterium]
MASHLYPPTACAAIPSTANSTVPACILLADARSPAACQVIVIRDANNNPKPGATVTFDFSACPVGEVELCATQPDQPVAVGGTPSQPATVSCGGRMVSVDTDGNGQVCVAFIGATTLAHGHGPAARDRPVCCQVSADTKFMGLPRVVTVASYDLNGDRTILATDLAEWLAYAGGDFGIYRSKADYNCNGRVVSSDLSLWLACASLGLRPTDIGCDTFCP